MEDESTNQINLDKLPFEIYQFYLFKYFELDEIFELKLVSWRLYFIVRAYEIEKLSLASGNDNWFSTTEPIDLRNQLPISKLPLLMNPSTGLLNLKYLKIHESFKSIKFEILNEFKKLQILVLKKVNTMADDQLNLPDLKALSISFLDSPVKRFILTIDAPNLHSLNVWSAFNIEDYQVNIVHSHSIKHLILQRFEVTVLKFVNLECLELYQSFHVDDILSCKNLKKVRVFDAYSLSIRDKLRDLFNFKTNDLELVIDGVRIKHANKISEYKWNNRLFQLGNYEELEDELSFFTQLEYADLFLLSAGFASKLFDKFNNVKRIVVNKRIQQFQLINFIVGSSNLDELIICKKGFTQKFYDRLPEISSLIKLKITDTVTKLNFGFIMKMSYLEYLSVYQDVYQNSNLNLNNLKRLKTIDCKIKKQSFCVLRKGKDQYKILNYESLGLPDQVFNHNSIISWSNYLRDKKVVKNPRKRFCPYLARIAHIEN